MSKLLRRACVVRKIKLIALAAIALAWSAPAYADCSSPSSPEGGFEYFPLDVVFKFCDGTNWISVHDGDSSSSGLWQAGPGDSIYYNSGTPQVGIGTDSPDDALDVVGTAQFSGSVVFDGQVAINTLTASSGLELDVDGKIGAIQYCDENGANCFAATDVGSGSLAAPGSNRQVIFNDGGVFGASSDVVIKPGTGGVGAGGDITTGFITHYALNETSGTTANDSAGSNNGTLGGNPTWGTGKIGNALDLDGNEDKIDVNLSTPSANFTFSTWVKSSQTGTLRYLYDQGSPRLILAWLGNTSNQIGIFEGGGWKTFGVATPNDNAWHHLAFVFTTSTAKLYIDGVQSGSTLGYTNFSLSSSDAQSIGGHYEDPGLAGRLDGQLDDVRIYSRSLSDTDVQTLYEIGEPPIGNGDAALSIGDTTPDGTLKLDVEGQIGATEYCDENGANCFDHTDVGGGATALDDLTDVSAGTPALNDVLAFDGTNWIAQASGGGSSIWTEGTGGTIYYNSGTPQVGIGTSTPGAALDVIGDIQYTGLSYDVSDIRLKKDIVPLPAALDDLLALKPVSFVMKEGDGEKELGFIAQDVEMIFPMLVLTGTDEIRTKSLNYVGLIAPLTKAVQELHAEDAQLRAENAELRARIERLEAVIEGRSE